MSRLARFTNNATSRLAANLSAGGLTLTVTPGDGAKFPSLTGGQYFTATLIKADGTKEIVKVTARATDTFTITRAYESVGGVQAAFAFSAGDKIELRMTAGALGAELDRLDLAALTRATNKSANYAVLESDISTLIRVDTAGGARTITLPAISSLTDAFEIVVTKITADTNLVNVTVTGDTINGGSTYSLSSAFQSAWIIADRATNTWTAINSGTGGSAPVVDSFTGSGTSGPFTLSGDPVSKNNTAVFIGGVYQQKSTYTLSAGAITAGGTVAVGVPVEVVWTRPVALGATTDDFVTTAPAPGGLWTSVRGFISWMYARYTELIGQYGSSLIGFLQAGVGAVARTVQDKLRETVSVTDFGADPTGSADSSAAFAAALATGKHVFVPEGVYLLTSSSGLSITTAYQMLYGEGRKAKLMFQPTVSAVGISVTNSTGWQTIRGLHLEAVSNVTKVVSVGAPDCTITDCNVINSTAGGHGIYVEDENVPSNIYGFDVRIIGNLIYGNMTVGAYGVRLGTNHQCAKVLYNSIQNWGTLVAVNGATTSTQIHYNILQRSSTAGAPSCAVLINRTGSGAPMYDIDLAYNYFEQNQICIYLDDCEHQVFGIRRNYFFRNTASKTNSFVYLTGANTNAASGLITVENNFIEDYEVVFGLAGQYASRFQSIKGNTTKNVTSWSSGTYADNAYEVRTINGYFNRKLVSGAFLSEATDRLEAKLAVFAVPLPFTSREYLEKITFRYAQTGGTGVTVELRKVTSDNSTDTQVATTSTISADTNPVTLVISAKGDDTVNYYIRATYNNTGTSGYVYPFKLFYRQ